jgi:hypothetical protein
MVIVDSIYNTSGTPASKTTQQLTLKLCSGRIEMVRIPLISVSRRDDPAVDEKIKNSKNYQYPIVR